jgi:protein phosphatase
MLFSGGRAALIHIGDSRAFQLRGCRLRPITEDHTLGHLTWSPGLLAPALKRHLDGRLDRSADLSLRDLRTCGRYLLRPSGLSPVADDRPHFHVLTLRPASTDAPSN